MDTFREQFDIGSATKWDEEQLMRIECAVLDENQLLDANNENAKSIIIKQLNDMVSYHLFSDGVREWAQKKKLANISASSNDLVNSLFTQFQKKHIVIENNKGIDVTKATLKRWIEQAGPPWTVAGRKNVFKLCFAMGLNEFETAEFFCKCYLERPFNHRSIEENVYFFCLKNNLGLSDAQQLIDRIKSETHENNTVLSTKYIKEYVASEEEIESFFYFMITHRNSFDVPSETIRSKLYELYCDCGAIAYAKEPSKYKLKSQTANNVQKKLSLEKILEVILSYPVRSSLTKDGKVIESGYNSVHESSLPKEVTDFMLNHTHRKMFHSDPEKYAEGSFQTMRKALILLHFYWYVESNSTGDDFDDFEGYECNINELLFECGFVQLYKRNPYDWLFLFCVRTAKPMETFRTLMEL